MPCLPTKTELILPVLLISLRVEVVSISIAVAKTCRDGKTFVKSLYTRSIASDEDANITPELSNVSAIVFVLNTITLACPSPGVIEFPSTSVSSCGAT